MHFQVISPNFQLCVQESDNSEIEINHRETHKTLIDELDYQNFLTQLEADIQENLRGETNFMSLRVPEVLHISAHKDSSDSQSILENQEISTEETVSSDIFDINLFWDEKNKSRLLAWAKTFQQDWKKISKLFGVKQITSRCVKKKFKEIRNAKAPLRVRFTHEEDLMIAKYYTLYSFDWKTIAEFIPYRTDIMVKNRFYGYIKKHDLLEDLKAELSRRELCE